MSDFGDSDVTRHVAHKLQQARPTLAAETHRILSTGGDFCQRRPQPSPVNLRWRDEEHNDTQSNLLIRLRDVVNQCLEAEVEIDTFVEGQILKLLDLSSQRAFGRTSTISPTRDGDYRDYEGTDDNEEEEDEGEEDEEDCDDEETAHTAHEDIGTNGEVGILTQERCPKSNVDADDEWDDDDDCGYTLLPVTSFEFRKLNGNKPALRRRRSSFVEGDEDEDADPIDRLRQKQLSVLGLAPCELRRSVDRMRLKAPKSALSHYVEGAGLDLLGTLTVRVVFDQLRTGFEDSKDFVATIGMVVGGRYAIEGLLGRAAFSMAYAAKDLWADDCDAEPVRNGSKRVCLKVIKNSKDFLDQSLDEIKLLHYLNDSGDIDANRIVRLVDYLYYKEHLIIATELLGENLFEYGKRIREESNGTIAPFPESLLRRVFADCLKALGYVHSLGMIHCDVKPENVVLTVTEPAALNDIEAKPIIKLIDFGSSCFVTDKLSFVAQSPLINYDSAAHFWFSCPRSYVQSRSYRAPEVVLGLGYDTTIDMWSLGCVVAEMHTGYVLFQNDSVATMLARITAIVGQFPPHMLKTAPNASDYFCAHSRNVYERYDSSQPRLSNSPLQQHMSSAARHSRRDDIDDMFFLILPKKTSLAKRLHVHANSCFLDLVASLLSIDPLDRPSAHAALRHPWLGHMSGLAGPHTISQARATSYEEPERSPHSAPHSFEAMPTYGVAAAATAAH